MTRPADKPQKISQIIYKWLDVALDCGIKECDFWIMTFAEITRAINSYQRVERRKAQEKASYDYILADLIGYSIGRIHSSSTKMPELATVYPSLFDSAEIAEKKQRKKTELSAIRFKQFADAHNKKIKGAANTNE